MEFNMNEYTIIALIYLAFLILFFVNLTVNLVKYFRGRKIKKLQENIRNVKMNNSAISKNNDIELPTIDTVNDISCSFLKENIYHDMVKNDSLHDYNIVNNTNNNLPHEF